MDKTYSVAYIKIECLVFFIISDQLIDSRSSQNRNKMATVGRGRGVFLSRLASIQTQAKNLYKCKRDSVIYICVSARETATGASELALRLRVDTARSYRFSRCG